MSVNTGQQQNISDEGSLTKYFSMMLHIDDDDLDPFEYKLLGHYRKQCGLSPTKICSEAIETTAAATKMGIAKARKARRELAKKGCIKLRTPKGRPTQVTIVDRMDENLARYGRRDPYQIKQGTPITSDSPPLSHPIPFKEYKEEKKKGSGNSTNGVNPNASFSSYDDPFVAEIPVR